MKVSANNNWLFKQLCDLDDIQILSGDPLLKVKFRGQHRYIYVPDSSEYIITIDCVEKVHEFGGNLVSYAKDWSRGPSTEAIHYASEHGIEIWPHGRTLTYFKGKKA